MFVVLTNLFKTLILLAAVLIFSKGYIFEKHFLISDPF